MPDPGELDRALASMSHDEIDARSIAELDAGRLPLPRASASDMWRPRFVAP